jgi:hypothetical protein
MCVATEQLRCERCHIVLKRFDEDVEELYRRP